ALHLLPACSLWVLAGASGCDDRGSLDNTGNVSWALQASGVSKTLVAVGQGVGIKSADLYAEAEGSGPDAPILKYEGGAWMAARPTVPTCLTCKTPRTASINDLTLNAALSGTVDRWNSATMGWTNEKTGLTTDILALWAADLTHVFAVGDRGGLALFDG